MNVAEQAEAVNLLREFVQVHRAKYGDGYACGGCTGCRAKALLERLGAL